jgi:hypothetical protein
MFEFLIVAIILGVYLFFGVVTSTPGKGGKAEKHKKLTLVAEATSHMSNKYLSWMPGFQVVPATSKTADWVFGLGISSRRTDGIVSRLKSRMNSEEISDKVKFHEHAAVIAPHLIAKTAELTRDESGQVVPVVGQTLPPGPWMLRANWGWKGKASGVAATRGGLEDWYDKLSARPEDIVTRSTAPPRVIASEYIRDPLTYLGLKFHARVHVLVIVEQHQRYAVMPNTIDLIFAGKPFVDGDWDDADVHDTHEARNPMTKQIDELPEGEILRKNTTVALGELFGKDRGCENMMQFFQQYPEAETTCELFGVDIMYRSNLSVVILEVNSRPSVGGESLNNVRDELITAVIQTAGVDAFGKSPFSRQILNKHAPFTVLNFENRMR